MITVVGGIKGGTGKTTIATNLAVLNSINGRKTLLIDADDQRSASDWADQRSLLISFGRSFFPTIALTGKSIHNSVNKMKEDYEEIVIDTGGRDTVSQRSALTCADVYILPFKPRSLDVWTVGKVKELADEIRTFNPKLKIFAFINQADPKGTDNEDALQILKDETDFFCLPVNVGYRKAFANAAAQGLGICEITSDTKSISELYILHRAIYSDQHI